MAAVFKRSYHPTATEHPAWDQTTAQAISVGMGFVLWSLNEGQGQGGPRAALPSLFLVYMGNNCLKGIQVKSYLSN